MFARNIGRRSETNQNSKRCALSSVSASIRSSTLVRQEIKYGRIASHLELTRRHRGVLASVTCGKFPAEIQVWRPVRESNPCRHREREALYWNSKETEARSGISKRRRNSLIAGATITFLTLCFTSGVHYTPLYSTTWMWCGKPG